MASDRTARSGLTLRQLALASVLGCALAAAAYTVGTSESPIGPVTVSPPGIATDPAQGTERFGDTHIAADRDWADTLHRAPIEINSGAPLFGSKSWTSPPPPVAKTAPTVRPFPFRRNVAFSGIGPGAVPMGPPGTAYFSPFGILPAHDQSIAVTSTGSTGGTVISPPTSSQMPIMPPRIGQMPILPPRSGNMPMFPPAPGATLLGNG